LENKTLELAEADQDIQKQLDGQNKEIRRHTRDIEELREMMKRGSQASSLATLPVLSKGGDDSGLIELIRKLEEQLREKSDRSECKRENERLQDQIDSLLARMKKAEEDQKISNNKIQTLEELIEKLKKDLANIDTAKIKQELMQLNQLVLNSATKVEMQQLSLEVKRALSAI